MMIAQENLLEALKVYQIAILSVEGNHVKVQNNYEIEVESNGLYKLLDDGYIVAPFNDLNDLCRFILS
jgi:hypothetical protein